MGRALAAGGRLVGGIASFVIFRIVGTEISYASGRGADIEESILRPD